MSWAVYSNDGGMPGTLLASGTDAAPVLTPTGQTNGDWDIRGVRVRIAVSGGSSLPVEIIKDVREKLGVQILEGYGLSETSPLATFSDPARDPRPGSIGVPVWGVELKLVDELKTSDDLLAEAAKDFDLYHLAYKRKRAWSERVLGSAETLLRG